MKKLSSVLMALIMVLSLLPTTVLAAESATGTVTPAFTRANGFWGEGKANSKESFVVELYEGQAKIASASLNNVDGIIDGDLYVTWSIPFNGQDSDYWNVEWAEGYPTYDMNPDAVKLFADGVQVAANGVQYNAPDDLNKIVALAEGFTGGVVAYTSLVDAVGDFNGRKVNVLRDVTECIEDMNGATLTTNVEGGVTITSTYDNYVYANDLSIGKGVTVKADNFFYETDGVNTIEGSLDVANVFYHGYDAKTTIQNGGTVTVGGTTILRYNKNADSGIYIYGDGDDATVEFDCDYYIGAYSGTFYAKDASVECGYFLLKNSYDNSNYADIDLTMDHSTVTIVGTDDGQDSFSIDDQASLTLANGAAIADVREFNILSGTNLSLSMDAGSSIGATNMNVAEDVPFAAQDNGDGTWSFETVILGEGTAEKPYLIGSLDQFKLFRDNVNAGETYNKKVVKLIADIDLGGEAWTPIGNASKPFNGTFDGDGHTIRNLVVNMPGKSDAGLFGRTNNGEIRNLTVENAKVTGRLNVGVVAGTPYTSKYTNINVVGHVEVNGMSYVGGVGGKNAYANWTNITVDVDEESYVKADSVENGTAYRTYVGGVIGFMGEGTHKFENITSNIDVIGNVKDVGGITGIAHEGNRFVNVTCTADVTNTAETADRAKETGGIAGTWMNQGRDVTFENCTFAGEISAPNVPDMVFPGGGLFGAGYNADTTNTMAKAEVLLNKTTYPTLVEALSAAQDGDTVTLLQDVELAESLVLDLEGDIIIDGNGYKLIQAQSYQDTQNGLIMLGATTHGDAEAAIRNYTIKNMVFDGIDSSKVRSVIRAQGVTLMLDGCTVKNVSGSRDTIIRLDYTEATIHNCTFDNNAGGGMVVVHNYNVGDEGSQTKLTVDECAFLNNTVALNSAVVYYVTGSGCSITNTQFVGNTINSAVNAATLYLGFQEDCTVTGCLFENNAVSTTGGTTRVAGAIFFGYEANISGNAFVNNTAANANGADGIGQSVCTSTYYDCVIDLNSNYWDGHAPVAGVDYLVQHQDGEGALRQDNYYTEFELDEEGRVDLSGLEGKVARIDDVGYTTLDAAVKAVKKGQTIVLLADNDETVKLKRNITFVLETAGYDLTGDIVPATSTCTRTVVADGTALTYTFKVDTPLGGGSIAPAAYAVTVTKTENGSVTAKPSKAGKGDKVELTVAAAQGYELAEIAVVDAKGNAIAVTGQDGKYVFTMPAAKVTVTATFKVVAETCPNCPAAKYTDLVAGAWYHDGVHFCVEKGLMAGTGETTFAPDENLSRAMVVQMLYNYVGQPATDAANKFSDVKADVWYYNAVRWGADQGVVSGYGEGRFGPDDNVTIEQAVAILHNYAGQPVVSGDAASLGAHSAWANNALNWAEANGILKGMPHDALTETATRAQMAQMLMNYLKNEL